MSSIIIQDLINKETGQTYKIRIEKYPYILNCKIQKVYCYYHNDKPILTYYTNGHNTQLFKVFHDLDNFNYKLLEPIMINFL
jgi:hypothetical protein